MNESTRTTKTVVLLHGLGRTSRSMQPLARALERRGYRVINISYPSRMAASAELAHGIGAEISRLAPEGRLHFITHSLGGILLRVATALGVVPVERIARVVMLAPPNSGTELVNILTARPCLATVYRQLAGPAGLELGVGPDSVPEHLPAVSFELGVIAGSRSVNPVFSALIPRPNDGKVPVSRTSVSGMRDMLVLPYPHPFLMRASVAIDYAIRFLETGAFEERRRARVLSGEFRLAL
jgi:triacylglycerol lipase